MSHYIVARVSIHDKDIYSTYEDGFMEIFSRYNGELLAVDEDVTVLEGEWPCTRTVLIQFPSEEEALAWYKSSEYQELAKHRFAASDADIALLKSLA